jgi:hypothetical protein
MTTTLSFTPEKSLSGERTAHKGLRSIESALAKARTDAELLDEPVLAYLVGMAIAEVNRRSRPKQEASRERSDGKTAEVVQLRDWFPKDC